MEPIYAVCWKYTYVLSSMHLFRFQYGDWGFCLGLIRLFQDLQKSCIFTFSGKLRPKIKTKHNIMKILLLWICKIYFPKERVLLSFVNGAEIDELFKCSLGRCPLVFPVVPWWPLCLSLPCGQSPVMPWPASRDRPHPYSVLGCRKSQWRGDGEINNADQSSWHAAQGSVDCVFLLPWSRPGPVSGDTELRAGGLWSGCPIMQLPNNI